MKTRLNVLALVAAGTTALAQVPSAPTNLRFVKEPTVMGSPIWGAVDPAILGTCSALVHDTYTLDGADGFRYRTWHPQVDRSGCVFAHEHGDNPDGIQNAEIASQPALFGYVGRRMPMPSEPNGHEEPHEGFKVFVANVGEANDEERINRVFSRSVFHMGTGGPRRFTQRFHSADIRLVHPEFGLKAFTRLMMDTGANTATVCDPRVAAPTKDVMSLQSPCLLASSYEIWSTEQFVRQAGQVVYQAFATPAVFDPITVFNPANPTEVVQAWDPRVNAIMQFPNDRSHHRGCDRESYAQPGYWYNSSTGRTVFYTDTLGNELPSTDPLAIAQTISQSQSVGAPATNDGLAQYKRRRSWCQNIDRLGLKN